MINIAYYEEIRKGEYAKSDSIPWRIIHAEKQISYDKMSAYPESHRFETIDKIKYFIVQFRISKTLVFEKYYAMNAHINDELCELLERTRAFRYKSRTVDFERIYDYMYDVTLFYDKVTDSYLVNGIYVRDNTYLDYLYEIYDRETVFEKFNWKKIKEKKNGKKILFGMYLPSLPHSEW